MNNIQMEQIITSNIVNGLTQIPKSVLTINNKQLPLIVANNIILSLTELSSLNIYQNLNPNQQNNIIKTSLQNALLIFYTENKKIITDEHAFFVQVSVNVINMTEKNDLIIDLSNDIVNGLTQIPKNVLTINNKQLTQNIADNILNTIQNTGTPQQQAQFDKLTQKEQLDIFEKSMSMALSSFYFSDTKLFDTYFGNVSNYSTQISTIVVNVILPQIMPAADISVPDHVQKIVSNATQLKNNVHEVVSNVKSKSKSNDHPSKDNLCKDKDNSKCNYMLYYIAIIVLILLIAYAITY